MITLNLKGYKTYRKYNFHTKKSIEYINIESGFDIETTSVKINDDKFSFMYLWAFGLGGNGEFLIHGRTWEEFKELINFLSNELNLSLNRRLVVYVHNLGYEFQFMRKYFKWFDVFSVDERKPIKATIEQGIEFRDSYILSGYNLKKTAENLQFHTIKKLVGDLDYSLVRHDETLITDDEMEYMKNDVLIILYYINEQLMQYENITKIPLTNTGRVREYVKKNCYFDKGETTYKSSKSKKKNYRFLMNNLTLEPDEYYKLKWAFMGGFTHANAYYTNKTLENVNSIDFTSSYPAVMLSEKFPMGKGFKPTKEEILKKGYDYYLNNFCCLIGLGIKGLENKFYQESYLSVSKCKTSGAKTVNNGRIYNADVITTYITDVDYWILKRCYSWEDLRIFDLICYPRNYLPKSIFESILELYKNKTTLKGVKGKETEYLLSKGMLNSVYGMTVTDIVRDEIIYNEEWSTKQVNNDEEIEKYNSKKSRFLFYPWGVWVTAYARRNLWSGIFAINEDYIYSDTDSIKFLNLEKHKKYIDDYNKIIEKKLIDALNYHNLDTNLLYPKTQENKVKLIGVWDYEGLYSKFKTLGAKRYLVEQDENLFLTVAGLGKSNGVKYMKEQCKNNSEVFKMFDNNLKIPAEKTGKMTHTYIDVEKEFTITDYQGNTKKIKSLSSIHLEPCEFSLSLTDFYIKFYNMLQNGELWKGAI